MRAVLCIINLDHKAATAVNLQSIASHEVTLTTVQWRRQSLEGTLECLAHLPASARLGYNITTADQHVSWLKCVSQ